MLKLCLRSGDSFYVKYDLVYMYLCKDLDIRAHKQHLYNENPIKSCFCHGNVIVALSSQPHLCWTEYFLPLMMCWLIQLKLTITHYLQAGALSRTGNLLMISTPKSYHCISGLQTPVEVTGRPLTDLLVNTIGYVDTNSPVTRRVRLNFVFV